jgi:hypothetical protein
MADPIVLAASASEDALVDAIASANATGAVILLEPGEHLTRRGRANTIAIGVNGLTIRSQDPSSRATIKRPDESIDRAHPDDNHGMFFVPEGPSAEEIADLQWHEGVDASGEAVTFAVIIRGTIRFEGVDIDCNMGRQGLPDDARLEHSSMLGFRGDSCEGPQGRVYVGFELVDLTDLTTTNGGYADDIWFSRGGFHPNIAAVHIDRLTSVSRVNRKRSTVDFSGQCLDIEISDSDIFELGMEDTATSYRDLPRTTEFAPSTWRLRDVRMDRLDLAARGKTYVLDARRLSVDESCHLDRAGGVVADSDLHVGPTTNRLLDRENRLVFTRVKWTLSVDDNGNLRGLKPLARPGETCQVAFFENTFEAAATALHGELINSELSHDQTNRVQVLAIECHYPNHIGLTSELPIARVNERGFWWFTPGTLGDRTIAAALPTGSDSAIHLVVDWWPFTA